MKSENNDQQLIDKLKQLPKVEDHRNKDELFQRISTQMNHKKSRKSYKLIPIFSALLVVTMIFVMVPILINLSMSEFSHNHSTDQNIAIEESDESGHEMALSKDSTGTDQSEIDNDIQLMDQNIESYVIENIDDHSTIIYGAVTDNQLQSVIPVSIIIPKTNNLNLYYNQMERYINASEWGVHQYLFKGAVFNIDLSNHEVKIQIPDTFSFGDGSVHENIFNDILATMFTPYQIEKVVLDKEVELRSLGSISELSLKDEKRENYKVFQADKHKRKFLVPIKIEDDVTIEDAFVDMMKGQVDLNVSPSIPDNFGFLLATSGDLLIITPDNDQVFEDEQKATIMIEAILMTAKSFGYKIVRFNHVTVDQVGPYVLSESIPVPAAINPIYQ